MGLEGGILQPYDVGIILSYKCQSTCKHCIFNCGPAWEEWMTIDDVQEALQVVRELGSVRQVHFTGGEPFLNFPLLLEAVKAAGEAGLPQYIETSAGWCTDRDLVDARFTALKEAGLTLISISCTPFHAETIPLTHTLLAIDRALEIFGPHRVMVDNIEMIDQIKRFGTRTPTPLYRYQEAFGSQPAGVMFWEGNALKSSGRASYYLGDLVARYPAEAFRRQQCSEELLHSQQASFDPYGNYIPAACAGISLGPWRDAPGLGDQFLVASVPTFLETLIDKGPYGLYNLVIRDYGYAQNSTGYVDKCHLCVDIRRHLFHQNVISGLAPTGFYFYF